MHKNEAQLTSAFDLFSKSADLVVKNIKTFAVLLFLPFLSVLGSMSNYGNVHKGKFGDFGSFSGLSGVPTYAIVSLAAFGIIIFIIFAVVALIVQAMKATLELEATKGKVPTLNHLWDLGKKFWLRLFGLYVLYGLLVVGGILLLIVPGLIMIRRYTLAPYILIDEDTTIGDAMKKSAKMTKPYSSSIWEIIGVMILISLTGIVPVIGGLISFVLGSLYSVAFALRYQELKKLF